MSTTSSEAFGARYLRMFHTVRHLRARQLFYYIWRRRLGARRVEQSRLQPQQRTIHFPALMSAPGEQRGENFSFTFLNQTLHFPADAMDWRPQTVNRLWRYNLHYFDFLRDGGRTRAEKIALLDDWIARNPQGSEPAWEPYTTSLRIVNWCKFLWSLPPARRSAAWLHSLFDQARWLERNLEYHILANHLFANIKALLFAGACFGDSAAARWLRLGQEMLLDQLREQRLDDGGHYERSPQYHCIWLEDQLDLLELARANPGLLHTETETLLEVTAKAALDLLAAIRTPDGGLPQFNDTAAGACANPAELLERGAGLGLIAAPGPALITLPNWGTYGWNYTNVYLMMDCGDIGPDYQPGHTHCDLLSYVLMVDGQWLVVDSGVCEYEPGEMRRYVRSTRAHNTVTVDDHDQSELWGDFRVGRRARKLAAKIERIGQSVMFEGGYQGFATLAQGLSHWREARLQLDTGDRFECLDIVDTLRGRGAHTVSSYIHLHPDIEARVDGAAAVLHKQGKPLANLTINSGHNIQVTKGWYCPEFGKKLNNSVLRIDAAGPFPLRLGYTLSMIKP